MTFFIGHFVLVLFPFMYLDIAGNIIVGFHNNCHILTQLLPAESNSHYNLRQRRHNLTLSVKTDYKNFVNRLTFKDVY